MASNRSKPQSGKDKPPAPPNPDAHGFTPERFERELKALAAKAKTDSPARRALQRAAPLLTSALLLALVGLSSTASQLALSPVYGSIPAARGHARLLATACFVGWAANLHMARLLPFEPHLLLPVVALWIPPLQFFLYRASGALAAWGPLATELLTLFPLAVLATARVASLLDGARLPRLPGWLADSAPGICSFTFLKTAEWWAAGWLPGRMGGSAVLTRVGLETALAAGYAAAAIPMLPSPRMLLPALATLAAPAVLHTVGWNTHAPTPWALGRLNATLLHGAAAQRADVGPWAVLERRESVTGYMAVLESLGKGFRVMRCDHSLLGGEWTSFQGMESVRGNQVAEPIFGVFVMLEAVRLVEVPERVPDAEAKALNIGLGIGTTPAALVAHGIDTTVVEIDPVVHEFAVRYFRLPSNHTAVIEDAVAYAARLAAVDERAGGQRFDYIVHDVFTGGAEPIALFTLEFLQDLATLLRPNGVIAINYAGDLSLPAPTIVLRTIRHVFPACSIFREHLRDDTEVRRQGGRDFANMVIFCTKQPPPASGSKGEDTGGGGITFRAPTEADLLNSPTRRAFMPPKAGNAVRLADFTVGWDEGLLTRNDTHKVAGWQEDSARGHWALMREVLPGVVWENW